MLRATTDHLTGQKKRVIDFAGLAEIRPDEGIMLWRVPVNGAVTVEEARSLVDGARDERQSGYLHTDVRGSTLAKTGWDAQMSLPFEEAEYGAWGETLSVSDVHGPPTHQFVGFEPDPATGWYFMGARVYDPTLRRWLSPDPLMLVNPEINTGEGIELNLYSYAGNNPIIYIDPDGTCRRNGKKIDCFSAAWETYQAITATTQKSFEEGNYGDAAVGLGLSTAQTVNVGVGFLAQDYADVWNAGVDAKNGDYAPLAIAISMAAIPGAVGKVAKSVGKRSATAASKSAASTKRSKTASQLPTPPTLPSKSIAKGGKIEIVHYTKSGDHGPAHMHVKGGGKEVRIGQNGKPLKGEPELSSAQHKLVKENKSVIRKAGKKIGRWNQYQEKYGGD